MTDAKSVMNQVDDLQVLVSKLKDLKVEVSEPLQVAAIIAKLPQTWNNYRKKLLHTPEDFTIDQLVKHIRIEEETRIRENKGVNEFGIKVNNVESRTKKVQKNFENKKKYPESSKPDASKKNKTCFLCGKKGHFKRDCRFMKRLKTENDHKVKPT